jgi:hypothetical protein
MCAYSVAQCRDENFFSDDRCLMSQGIRKEGEKSYILRSVSKNDGILSHFFEKGMSFFPFLFLSFWINAEKVKIVYSQPINIITVLKGRLKWVRENLA